MDRAAWHTTGKIKCFDNIIPMPLPPYAPELSCHRCLLTAIPSQVLCLLLGRLHQRYKRIQCFDNIIPMPLPPYAPELNPVEQLWLNINFSVMSSILKISAFSAVVHWLNSQSPLAHYGAF
jgi:hypothetical protein